MDVVHHRRKVGIQWLRALAAWLVVVDHGLYTLIEKAGGDVDWQPLATSLGRTGVELFFAISGYVMVVSSGSRFGASAAFSFVQRRLVRIVPLYWLATGIYFTKLRWSHDDASWFDLARSLLFIPYRDAGGEFQPVYGLGWTLNFEMFFYAVFAVGMLASRRATLFVSLGVLGTLVAFGQWHAGRLTNRPDSVWAFWSQPIVLFFLVGMVWAHLERRAARHVAVTPTIAALGSAVLVALAVAVDNLGFVAAGSLLLLGAAVGLASRSGGSEGAGRLAEWGTSLGDASYSIYLTHSFVIGPLGRLYGKLGWASPIPFVVIALLACSIVGWLCHRHVELPLLRRLRPNRDKAPALKHA